MHSNPTFGLETAFRMMHALHARMGLLCTALVRLLGVARSQGCTYELPLGAKVAGCLLNLEKPESMQPSHIRNMPC